MIMRLPEDRTECCPYFDPTTIANRNCFCQEICKQMMKILRRHKRLMLKNPRLIQLAKPRYTRKRFVPKCPCISRKPIEMINIDDKRERTRTEQLAYPSVRKLLLFKKRVRYLYDWERMSFLNRLIRNSLFSLYSFLHNVQPPVKPEPKKPWDKDEWKKHLKILKKLSKPKKIPKPPKVARESRPLEELTRLKKLAQPKKYICDAKEEWKFTPAMKNYKASDRIKQISKPRLYDESLLYQSHPLKISEGALNYKATENIKSMAMPIERRMGEKDTKESPFSVSPNALKYKTSQRMVEMSEPKEFSNIHIRENPYAVSPAALKAKPTPRIIKLAEPKSRG